MGRTKEELEKALASKRKKPMPAFVPINKKGEVRIGTASIEGGIAIAANETIDGATAMEAWRDKKWNSGAVRFVQALNPLRKGGLGGKVIAAGAAIVLFGKGKKVGPGRLN